jgi:hypothetical protein
MVRPSVAVALLPGDHEACMLSAELSRRARLLQARADLLVELAVCVNEIDQRRTRRSTA